MNDISMQHFDNQKALVHEVNNVNRNLHQLIEDIQWTEALDEHGGYLLQCEVKDEEEANALLSYIENLFGFDLAIELTKNPDSTILLTIPSFMIVEMDRELEAGNSITIEWPNTTEWGEGELNAEKIIDEFTQKIIEINEQFQQSLANTYNGEVYIIENSSETPTKTSTYYFINKQSGWGLFYLHEDGRIEEKFIKGFDQLAGILERLQNNEKIPSIDLKQAVIAYERARAITTWDASLKNLLFDLQQTEGINNRHILNEIVGKVLMQLFASSAVTENELLMVLDNPARDDNLAAVIDMCFRKNNEKNIELIVLNKMFKQFLTSAENEENKFTVGKFSILGHWSVEFMCDHPEDAQRIVDFAADLIEKMPDLKKVVLRGCSTAVYSETPSFKPKTCTVLSKDADIHERSVDQHEFLFQQVAEQNKFGTTTIRTYLKFYDLNNQIVTKALTNIPLNTWSNKLSNEVEERLALSSKANNLPPLSLPTLDRLKNEIRNAWLRNESISQEHKKILKATLPRVTTYAVSEFPVDSLASMLDSALQEKQIKVELKGYLGPYLPYEAGVMLASSHGRQNAPKALSKFTK